MIWYPFDKQKGSKQKRPTERREVLVILDNKGPGLPKGVAIGYMRNAGGDKECPYFVIPGIGGEVVAWSDILASDFQWPKELT